MKKFFFEIGSFIILSIFTAVMSLSQENIKIGLGVVFILMVLYLILVKCYSKISYFDIGFFLLFLVGIISSAFGGKLFWIFTAYTPANIYATLTLVAFLPLLLGKEPFTYHFAKESEPEITWQTPQFKAINLIITLVWGIIFFASLLISIIKPINFLFTFLFPIILQLGIGLPFTLKFPKIYLKKNLPKEAFSAYIVSSINNHTKTQSLKEF